MRKILISLLAVLLVLATVMSLGACAVTTEPEDPNDTHLGTEMNPGANLTPSKPGDTVVGEMSGTQGSGSADETPDLDTTPATAGLEFKLSADGTYYKVFSYEKGTEKNVYIPYTYEGLPVLEIGYGAFDGTAVESVNIPKFVTKISAYAFRNSAIKTVSLSASVESIAQNAFDKCASLESFTVDAANETYTAVGGVLVSKDTVLFGTNSGVLPTDAAITKVADFAFSGRALSAVTIPENITFLGKGVFMGSSLSNITLHNGITALPDSFVDGCIYITSINLPDSIETIGYAAFRNTSLTQIDIPSRVTEIQSYTFYGCTSLDNVTLPDSLTSIGGSSFAGCTKLQKLTVPASVTFIGGFAFKDCSVLTTIGLDKSSKLESLGSGAFMNCVSLTEMFLPSTMITGFVGTYVFYGCLPEALVVRADLSGAPSGGKYSDWDTYKADIIYEGMKTSVVTYSLDIRYKSEQFCHDCNERHIGDTFGIKNVDGKTIATKWECPETGHIHTYKNVECAHCTEKAGEKTTYGVYVCSENGWKCPAIYTDRNEYHEGHPDEYNNKTVACDQCITKVHKVTVAADGTWTCPAIDVNCPDCLEAHKAEVQDTGAWVCTITNNPHNVNYTVVDCPECSAKHEIPVADDGSWVCPVTSNPHNINHTVVDCPECSAKHELPVAADGAWVCPLTNNSHNVNDSTGDDDQTGA